MDAEQARSFAVLNVDIRIREGRDSGPISQWVRLSGEVTCLGPFSTQVAGVNPSAPGLQVFPPCHVLS